MLNLPQFFVVASVSGIELLQAFLFLLSTSAPPPSPSPFLAVRVFARKWGWVHRWLEGRGGGDDNQTIQRPTAHDGKPFCGISLN